METKNWAVFSLGSPEKGYGLFTNTFAKQFTSVITEKGRSMLERPFYH